MSLFPDSGDEPKDEIEEEDEIEDEIILYLWEEHFEVYQMFKLLAAYVKKDYAIDTALLLSLIADKKLPLEDTLYNIAYIRAGYLEIVLAGSTASE